MPTLVHTVPEDMPDLPVRLPVPDLAPYLAGNTGIPGFTTIDSGAPGPHAVIVALIHGNEIAGAIALAELLGEQFTPACGRLTLGFANLAAFARFDPAHPLASRFIEEDLNRVWDDVQLFGVRRSAELDRAREIRPLIETADLLLDLHSMLWPSDPLLLSGPAARGEALARRLGTPPMVIADRGHAGGKRLIDYGRFTATAGNASGILVEAGRHWQPETLAQTHATIRAFLAVAGMAPAIAPPPQPRVAHVTAAITARTNRFAFVRAFQGGEIIARAGTLIAHDGDQEIRTPYDDCVLVMPSLLVCSGHTAVRLAQLESGTPAL